jgi:hypothetical protein
MPEIAVLGLRSGARDVRTAEAIGGGNMGAGLDGRAVDPELSAAARLTDPSFYAGNPHPV